MNRPPSRKARRYTTAIPHSTGLLARLRWVLQIVLGAALGASIGSAAPSLLFDEERLTEIRSAISVAGSAHAAMYSQLKNNVDTTGTSVIGGGDRVSGNWNYARAYLAAKAALIYAISGDSSYAQIAYDALWRIHNDPDPDKRLPDQGYGLARATVGLGFAYAWDMCRDGWSADQQNYVRGKISDALNAWPSYSHANLSAPYGSNWVAVCHGGELLLMLAVGEQGTRASRCATLVSRLSDHVSHYGNAGWGQEGNHYVPFAMEFLLPAALGLQVTGNSSLYAAVSAKSPWKAPMFAGMFDAAQDATQWGVGGNGMPPNGYTSLLFAFVPGDRLPHYKWFYDRYRGLLNPAASARRFDPDAYGPLYALLFYPESTPSANPHTVLGGSLADDRGGYWLRSRWQDAEDVIVSLATDTTSHDKAWNEADALQINIAGFGTRFSGAPGTSGNAARFSQVLVDDQARVSTAATGGAVILEPNYAIASGGAKYAALGLTGAIRHVFTDFSGNFAIISTLDKLRAGSPKSYTWQMNPLGLPVSSGIESGLPTFTVFGKDGAWLKGWVVSPAGATVSTDGSLRIAFPPASSRDVWVAMALGKGSAPVPSVTGAGLGTQLRLGDRVVRFENAADRICSSAAGSAVRASFSVNPPTGLAPATLGFDATASTAPGGALLAYEWDFGDGSKSSDAVVNKTYSQQGRYLVRLRVSSGPDEDFATQWISISNTPPVASILATPNSGPLPLAVRFSGANSSDADGHPLSYAWDFGDGTIARGPVVYKTYSAQGSYYPTLTVSDGHGGVASETLLIVAGNRSPVAVIAASVDQGLPPLTVSFSGSGSLDPDGDDLSYSWDFGDGTTATGRDIAKTFNAYGKFPVVLSVSDKNGNLTKNTKTIIVENKPPSSKITASTTSGSAPLTVAFSGNQSSDPEGEALSFSWDFGDGNRSTHVNPSQEFNTPGHYRVTLEVQDVRGASSQQTIEISVLDSSGRRLPDSVDGLQPGLIYEVSSIKSVDFPNFDALTPFRSGVINRIETRLDAPPSMFAYRFSGYLYAPNDGHYTFHHNVRDTLVVRVGGTEVINRRNRDLSGNMQTGSGAIALRSGWHSFEVLHHFADAGDFNEKEPWLELTWSGPDFENQPITSANVGWIPGLAAPAFRMSPAPENLIPPSTVNFEPVNRDDMVVLHTRGGSDRVTVNFDARPSLSHGHSIESFHWDFGDGNTAVGLAPTHSFLPGDHRIVLTTRTAGGTRKSLGRLLRVEPPPTDLNRARELTKQLLASAGEPVFAFDGDRRKSSRWLVWADSAWVEMHFSNAGIRNRYVVNEYAITNPNDWNARDPKEVRFYGSHDGINWSLLDERLNINWNGRTEHTMRFPVANSTAYSSYRMEIEPTAESPQGWITEVQEIELYDHGTGERPINRPPTAAFTVPVAAEVGTSVFLDGGTSSDPDSDPLLFFWDFGDGQTAQTSRPQTSYTFLSPGAHTIRLQVRDSRGILSPVATHTMVVSDTINQPPNAAFTAKPPSRNAPGIVEFDASLTHDANGDPLTFQWEFGDGTTGEGARVSHAYDWGTYGVRLTVRDSRGGVAVSSGTIQIQTASVPRSISLNFAEVSNRFSNLLRSESAGTIPATNWNNISAASSSGLLDNSGKPTTASVSRTATGFGNTKILITSPSRRFLSQSIGSSSANHSVTLSGIPYSSYRIYVYAGATPDNGNTVPMRIRLGSRSLYLLDLDRDFDGVLSESQSSLPEQARDGDEYVVFRGLSGPSQTIHFVQAGRLGPAAIQIVEGQDYDDNPPVFIWNPISRSEMSGQNLQLTGTVLSRADVTYQWTKNGIALADGARVSGSQSPLLQVLALKPEDAGTYLLLATNSNGMTSSQPAIVTVSPVTDLLVEENFHYPEGNAAFTASWNSGTTNVRFNGSTNLSFIHPSYETQANNGGCVTTSPVSSFRGIQRTATISPSAGTFWISSLVSVTSNTSGAMVFLSLNDFTGSYSSSLPRGDAFGLACDGSQLRVALLRSSGGVTTPIYGTANGNPAGADNVYLLIARVTIGPGDDSLALWAFKPGDSFDRNAESLGEPLLQTTSADFGSVLRNLWLGQISASGAWDAIRISNRTGNQGLTDVLGFRPPVITKHPSSTAVESGQNAIFTVTVSGLNPVYVWERNGIPIFDNDRISGSRTSALHVSEASAEDAGVYRVKVSTHMGETFSDPATLTVGGIPDPVVTWYSFYALPTDGDGDGADAADPDGDGFANLLEYALGTTPTDSSEKPEIRYGIAHLDNNEYLEITIPKGPAGRPMPEILLSRNLDSWQAGAVDLVADAATFRVYRDQVPLSLVRRCFLRLKVNRE